MRDSAISTQLYAAFANLAPAALFTSPDEAACATLSLEPKWFFLVVMGCRRCVAFKPYWHSEGGEPSLNLPGEPEGDGGGYGD